LSNVLHYLVKIMDDFILPVKEIHKLDVQVAVHRDKFL